MSVVQDGVIGSYLLTDKDTFLDRAQFFDLSMHVKYSSRPLPKPAIFYKDAQGRRACLYTGKQLMEYIAPRDITFTKSTRSFDSESDDVGEKSMDPDERFVVVADGELVAGKFCKATIGSVSRGMVHRIHYKHGAWQAAKWISDLQRVVTHFLSGYGFSIGMEDCVPSDEIETKVAEVVRRSVDAVYAGTEAARKAGVDEVRIEAERMRVLSDVMLKSAQVVLRHVSQKNSILQCIQSGSKGKKLNICQILGVLGQQIHTGARIHDKMAPGSRTLSCFDDDDMKDPRTHGLVDGSYRMGLDPAAFFFHCMTGREGLIDTACKTAETGYLQRRIGKILESDHVATDMSVRDGDNNLILTVYGGDGIDPEKQLKIPIGLLKSRGEPEDAARRWCGRRANDREVIELADALSKVRAAFQDATGSVAGEVYIPFDPEAEMPAPRGDVHLKWEELGPLLDAHIREIHETNSSTAHFELALRAFFTCNRLGCVSPDAVRSSLLRINTRIRKAAAAPGMMCGTIAAQSIGEPATQMTLNTFHSAGAGNKTVQRGVPRVKEIIDTSKNPATPSMEIYFRPEIARNEAVVRQIATEMTLKILRDYVVSYDLFRVDNAGGTVAPEQDTDLVETHNLLFPEPSKPDWSQWVGRLILDRQKLLEKGMRVSHVRNAAKSYLGDKVQVIASEDADDSWILRLRICKLSTMAKLNNTNDDVEGDERLHLDKIATTDVVEILMDTLIISGVSNITKTYVARRGDEFIVETDGSSLAHVLASGDAVDFKRVTSNHIHEVMSVLGIEATCSLIYQEASDVLSDSGEYVSARHLTLLSSKMTHYGQPVPVTRHGMKRAKQGVLVSASFERTVETFVEAAVHGIKDSCGGVTESIVMVRVVVWRAICVFTQVPDFSRFTLSSFRTVWPKSAPDSSLSWRISGSKRPPPRRSLADAGASQCPRVRNRLHRRLYLDGSSTRTQSIRSASPCSVKPSNRLLLRRRQQLRGTTTTYPNPTWATLRGATTTTYPNPTWTRHPNRPRLQHPHRRAPRVKRIRKTTLPLRVLPHTQHGPRR